MRYMILIADNVDALELAVNAQIAKGWTPLGGVAVARTETRSDLHETYAQAMTTNNHTSEVKREN